MKLLVVSGFLGAGKTTAVLDLARRLADDGRRVGVITNDQSDELVDTARVHDQGVPVEEVPGGCFCCRLSEFVARAERLIALHSPDVLLAEPVGSCTDLVATLLRPLRDRVGSPLEVGPLTVLVDPLRLLAEDGPPDRGALGDRVRYVFDRQPQEADVVAVTRSDLLDDATRAHAMERVRARFPHAETLACSPRTGDGMASLLDRLLAGGSALRALADIDYGRYADGEAALAWVDLRAGYRAPAPFQTGAVLMALAGGLQDDLAASGAEIAHLKVRVEDPGGAATVSVVSNTRPAALDGNAESRLSTGRLVVNARLRGDAAAAEVVVRQRFAAWADALCMTLADVAVRSFHPDAPVPEVRVTDPDDDPNRSAARGR